MVGTSDEPSLSFTPRYMELRHLRYFVTIAEALSFTKAAQILRVAQPSLTRQMRNLEDEIGVRLLDRTNHRTALTNEGRVFLFDAKKLLAMSLESVAAVRRLNRLENARLNIGYGGDVRCELLPITLGAFRKLCPQVAINLFEMSSAEQFEALDDHRIDLGFVGLPSAFSGHDFSSECVAHHTVLVALPARHTLARNQQVKLADLASQYFVGMSAKTHPGAREWLLETCRTAGFEGRILQETEELTAAIRFVAHGLGVALMNEHVIAGLADDGVVFRPLSAAPLRINHRLASRQRVGIAQRLHSDREGFLRQHGTVGRNQ
jgi:DNA-binding transcriptional LysR family regulator